MSEYIEKAEQLTLPVVVLRGIVAFPAITLNFEVTDEENLIAIEKAEKENDGVVFLVTTTRPDTELDPKYFARVGTVSRIKQIIRAKGEKTRVIAEGISRATLRTTTKESGFFTADAMIKTVLVDDNGGDKGENEIRKAKNFFREITAFIPNLAEELGDELDSIQSIDILSDFIAANVMIRNSDKQKILEAFNPTDRISQLNFLLQAEIEMLRVELEMHQKVREKLNEAQRERYLREQYQVIREELGGADEEEEYFDKIMAAKLPTDVTQKLLKENKRMENAQFGSAEASVIRNYLDICLELPWNKRTADRADVAAAKKILDADHYGLTKVKERILEFLAVKKLNPELRSQILCLVGPPGTGKTSIAQSIAKAMHRKYVRVSLGGVRDEADIRGHRKTYVGAMPGRVINALIQAETSNPLMLLDEIDKVGSDGRGDPTAALLEVLDPEQNSVFRDHFIELPFDISDCLFVCTANSLESIPRPLIDRMEIIELSSYTRNEKLMIAKNHLVPKQMKRHGLNGRSFRLTDEAIIEVIDYYTKEAGVRNLEREVAALCRKAALRIVEGKAKRVTVDKDTVEEFLGVRKITHEKPSNSNEVGVVNGLAYTEVGGALLKIETAVMNGSGKLELTGSLGDVMKESARAALSYIRSVADKYEIDPDFYKNKDIHLHFPEGAIPKDGPSAGLAIVTALVSALTGRGVKSDIAMTGEVTLRGNALPIGGLREKTMAAYANGIGRVIIPEENMPNLEDIDPEARENLEFISVRHVSEVLDIALCD